MELLISAREAQYISKRNGGLDSLFGNVKFYITEAAKQGNRNVTYSTYNVGRSLAGNQRDYLTTKEAKIVKDVLTNQGFKVSIARTVKGSALIKSTNPKYLDTLTIKW